MRIGINSDTHGLLRPEACARLAGVDHIIHAGDIGRPEVIAALRELAPTTAIRGNIDTDRWTKGYPHTARLTLGGRSIHVLHDLKDLDLDPAAGIDVVVSGHSHCPKIETVGGVLYLNPGSAGPRGSPCLSHWRPSSWRATPATATSPPGRTRFPGRQRPERRSAGANDREPALIS